MRILAFIACAFLMSGTKYSHKIALLKYNGGGDWYANLETSLPNLIRFCNKEIGTQIDPEQAVVEVGSVELFDFPFVHMTGHGNVIFNDSEVENLRKYLLAGGFLHIDDNYGLDQYVRREMQKVFPEKEFKILNANHEIFRSKFRLNGLPKVHEHDKNPAVAYALFDAGRMVCLYTSESDLGDGWEDAQVHNDSQATRIKALQMGANILQYVFFN